MRLIASQIVLHAHVDIVRKLEQQLPPHAADRRNWQHVDQYPAIGADEPRIGALGDDVRQCRHSDHRAGCEVRRNLSTRQSFAALELCERDESDTGMDGKLPTEGGLP